MRIGTGTALIAGVVVLLASAAFADVLATNDGKTYEGVVLSKDASGNVSFEVHMPSGGTATLSFTAERIASITPKALPAVTSRPVATTSKPAADLPKEPAPPPIVKYDGPTYYLIPLKGEVGKNILASQLEKSLEDASKRNPTVVILDVNSPGGMIQEAEKIIAVIRKYNKKLHIVTLADQDFSAAAILSMATKEIYLKPSGMIGAATAYQRSPGKLPAVIAEKFQSVWRAAARSSAETGGHPSLLAEGMIDNTIELCLVEEDGKKEVREGSTGTIILHKGKILTMTADEAVRYGLADGKAEDYDQLGAALKFPKWVECKGLGTLLADYWDKTLAKLDAASDKLDEQLAENLKLAKENDPTNFQYRYYANNGKYTSDSVDKWRKQCGLCVMYLTRAEKNLQDEIDLASKYNDLKSLAEFLTDYKKDVSDKKKEILRKASKSGPGD